METWETALAIPRHSGDTRAHTKMREEPVVIDVVFLEKLAGCAGTLSGDAWEGHQPGLPGVQHNLCLRSLVCHI